jgi:predicted metal-dependent hydrolase
MRLLGQPRKKVTRQLAGRELLRIDGDFVPVTLRLNPRARRLIVKVHPSTGEVTVVAPSRRSLEGALAFARSETDWIRKRLARVPKPVPLGIGERVPFRGELHHIVEGEKGRAPVWADEEDGEPVILVSGRREHASRRILDFLKREARKTLDARTAFYADRLGIKPRRITVRDTASRWGSCSAQRTLSFSWRLILAPDFVLDYVVAHEVAHMKEMNHSPRFWQLVELLGADVKRAQRWLSDHGAMLHRYAPRIVMD